MTGLLAWLAHSGATASAGLGLTAEYFSRGDFTGLQFVTTNATVDFDWGTNSPGPGLGPDAFAVRWSGQVEARFSEVYAFHVAADEGVRLWVNDRLLAARAVRSAAVPAISGCLALQAGRRYNLVLEFIEDTGPARVQLAWSSASQPYEVIPQSQLFPTLGTPERGSVLKEHWTGLPGTNLSVLTNAPSFPTRPDGREFLPSFECLQPGWSDSYGTRMSGYLIPPTNGLYVLALAADDTAQLFLSSDANPAHRALIASVPDATGFREFDRWPSQVSAPVSLTAGQPYWIELLHKEGTGDDHFSVAWRSSGGTEFTVIPADALVPAGLHRAPPAEADFFTTLAPSHPRLLATGERFEWLRRTIDSNSVPLVTRWWATNLVLANNLLTLPPSTYTTNERGTILQVCRDVLDRVARLAVAYRVTADASFAERAWTELEAAANFPDWQPTYFLSTAEMTHAVALGYDWLFDYWSPARRDTLRNAIVNKGLTPSLSYYANASGWAATNQNNWNLVCNGGMVLGVLAVAGENSALVESNLLYILSRALPSASAVMRHYTADNGGWYEGPIYWEYATAYNVRMLAALESALGSDFGLSDTRGLAEAGLFPLHLVGPSRLNFNFADAADRTLRGPQLFWLARRFNRPEYAWHERTYGVSSALDLLWYDSRGSDPSVGGLAPDNAFRGPTSTTPFLPADAVTLRSRWGDTGAIFAGFKAGEIGASHGHCDAGSFVFDALGRRWAHDLGPDDYDLPDYFREAARTNYYRIRAEGQNTLVINPDAGAGQMLGTAPAIVLYQSELEGGRSLAVADLTAAYGQARVWRGVQLLNQRRWFLVQDEIQTASPANVWWFMHLHTNTTVEFTATGDAATLTQGSDRLWLKILSGPGRFALSNAAPLPSSPITNQSVNASFRKLAIQLSNVTDTTLAVLMVPLSAGAVVPVSLPTVVPLREWGQAGTPGPVPVTKRVSVCPGGTVDVDLVGAAYDADTAASGLQFALLDATGGSATLLPDGRTARFTASAHAPAGRRLDFAVSDLDPRLLAAFDFESPLPNGDPRVADKSGNYRDGWLDVVGAGSFAFDTNTPPGQVPRSSRSLRLASSVGSAARLSFNLSKAEHDLSDSDWSFAVWFRRESTNAHHFLFYSGSGNGFGPFDLQLYCRAGDRRLFLEGQAGLKLTSSGPLNTSEWYHAAVVFERTNVNTGIVRLYLNGTALGSASATFNLNQTLPLRLGGHASTSSGDVARWLDGYLEDAALFRAALTIDEIRRLTNQPLSGLVAQTAVGTVTFTNLSPEVTLTAPLAGASIRVPTNLLVSAQASDADGPVAQVEFFANDARIGACAAPPYAVTLSNLNVGPLTLTAVVTDSCGATASTSLSVTGYYVAPFTFIPTGAVWRYLDTGVDQGTAWRSNPFTDAAWFSGPAQLGFGDGDEATVIASNQQVTTYFRREFYVPDPARVLSLNGRLLRDDGALVFLNGLEVWRSNMPGTNPINSATLASAAVPAADETSNYYTRSLNPARLVAGANLLAVEVHQNSPTSDDLSFDFELTGTVLLTAQPSLRAEFNRGQPQLVWPADAGWFTLQTATNLAPPVLWQPAPDLPVLLDGQWTVPLTNATGGARFYRLLAP
jgi:hypothetical protein